MPSGFQDTISSASSHYNNQYRNDPGIVQGYAKIHAREMKDTLETKQQRLERHLETQFHLNQQVPSGKIVVIAQVGKYAILALVMPPFYLFYEGPRWVLITIQPFVMIAFEKAGAFLLMISTFGVDFWAKLGKQLQFFKKPKNFVKEKFKTVNQALSERMIALGQKLYQAFQPINKAIEKLKNYIAALQEKRAAAVHFFKIFPKLVLKKIEENKDGFKAKIQDLIAMAAQIKIPFIAVKKVIEPVVQVVQKQMAVIIKPVLKAATLVLEISKNVMNKVWVQTKVAANIVAMPFNLALKAIESPLKNAIKRIEGVLKAAASTSKEIAIKFANVATVATVIPMQKGFVQIRSIAEQAGLNLIQKTKVVLERLKKIQPIVKRVLKTLWDEGKKHSKKGFAKFKKAAIASTQTIVKALVWGWDLFATVPSKLYVFWNKFQKWVVKQVRRVVWGLRVALAWTKVILRYTLAHLWD